jgi:mono/diheme cytochrome c family protein
MDRGTVFSGSGACAVCHTQNTDESGADVSLDSDWRASVHAQAARDPYWQASVRAEAEANPSERTSIEDACATCHMPMARYTVSTTSQPGLVLDAGFLDPGNPLHSLAMDGVSCSLCHQIRGSNLGSSSFSGKFAIDTAQRQIFGPYSVTADQAALMQVGSGFQPLQGLHMGQPEMCATCHMIYTPILDRAGGTVGEFPQQASYLEWFYSDYRSSQSCQGCHMPAADGGVNVASSSTDLRSPFLLHTFSGGNAYLLGLLRIFGDELGVTASGELLQAARERSLGLLQQQTAALSLENVGVTGVQLGANVVVTNKAGHKFPTGFPSRRAWIHLSVKDSAGNVVFESGAVQPDGSIVGDDNDGDPSLFEPHYTVISRPDQVEIYETILKDTAGRVTTGLNQAAGYVKDNRILPSGFDKGAPYQDVAVWGGARDDPLFLGGSDRVQVLVNLGQAPGPYTLTVELLYQAIGYRWAESLRAVQGPEVQRFLGFYDATPNTPIVVASVTQQVQH